MPRVRTAVARRDYPDHGIEKGNRYWYWTFYRGRKQMSAKPPKRSQLTQREELQQIYDAEDLFGGWEYDRREELAQEARDAAEMINNAAETARDKASNIGQYFQSSEKVDELEQLADECENLATELEQLAESLDGVESEEEFEELDEPSNLNWPSC